MADSTITTEHELSSDNTAGVNGYMFKFDGMTFTMTTEGSEVAQVGKNGAVVHVLRSESFFDAGTGTTEHFVHVQGKTEAMLLLVSVNKDQHRIVGIRRFS